MKRCFNKYSLKSRISRSNLVTEESQYFQRKYLQKMNIRCENQISHSVLLCLNAFSSAYDICNEVIPSHAAIMCWPLMLPRICDVKHLLGPDICNSAKQVPTKATITVFL